MKLITTFEVLGVEAVPWTVPNIGNTTTKTGKRVRFARRSKKSSPASGRYSLEDWQSTVRSAAVASMRSAGYTGPLTDQMHVKYEFFATTPAGKRHGELWPVELSWDKKKHCWSKTSRDGKTDPDLTNVIKSTEDGMAATRHAVADAVFENDCVVRSMSAVTLFGPMPGVRVSVYVIEDADYPGEGEPIPP
jgi:hypothetical protein